MNAASNNPYANIDLSVVPAQRVVNIQPRYLDDALSPEQVADAIKSAEGIAKSEIAAGFMLEWLEEDERIEASCELASFGADHDHDVALMITYRCFVLTPDEEWVFIDVLMCNADQTLWGMIDHIEDYQHRADAYFALHKAFYGEAFSLSEAESWLKVGLSDK